MPYAVIYVGTLQKITHLIIMESPWLWCWTSNVMKWSNEMKLLLLCCLPALKSYFKTFQILPTGHCRAVRIGGAGELSPIPPPFNFGRSIKPYLNRVGRFCPSHYYLTPRNFKPSYGPGMYILFLNKIQYVCQQKTLECDYFLLFLFFSVQCC